MASVEAYLVLIVNDAGGPMVLAHLNHGVGSLPCMQYMTTPDAVALLDYALTALSDVDHQKTNIFGIEPLYQVSQIHQTLQIHY